MPRMRHAMKAAREVFEETTVAIWDSGPELMRPCLPHISYQLDHTKFKIGQKVRVTVTRLQPAGKRGKAGK